MSTSYEASSSDEDTDKEDINKEETESSRANGDLMVVGTSQAPPPRRYILLPGAKSKVLKYFGFETDNSKRILKSNIVFWQVTNCCAKITYSKNMTNLSKHLEHHHPTEFSKVQVQADVSTTDSESQPRSSGKPSKPLHLQTKITDTYLSVEPYCKTNPRYVQSL